MEYDRLFILGKPGAGKTTFLKYATLQAVEGKINNIPIFIALRDFSETTVNLFDFIVEQFAICDFPDAQNFLKTLLSTGKAIVLFDALDEVITENGKRDRVITEIKNFNRKFGKNKYIITCRHAAVEYNFEGFTYVEMADFEREQIKTFVNKWFNENIKVADNFLKEFNEPYNSRLRNLAKSPLLLTLLCISYEETLNFPSHRSEIYEEAIDALLKKWDTSRIIKRDTLYRKLSLDKKRKMFSRIGAETFEKKQYLIDKKVLEKLVISYLENLPHDDDMQDIDGMSVIKTIEAQHGIWVVNAHTEFIPFLT